MLITFCGNKMGEPHGVGMSNNKETTLCLNLGMYEVGRFYPFTGHEGP
jgi:hypothetical protein